MKKCLLSAILLFLLVGALHAATVTKYYGISCVAFLPTWNTQPYERWEDGLYSTGFGTNAYFTPVYLPDSANVTEFRAWVHDVDDSLNVVLYLSGTRHNDYSSTITMAAVQSSGASGDQELTDATIDSSVIDNATYNYWAYVNMPSGMSTHKLRSVRIKYEITTTGIQEGKKDTDIDMERVLLKQNRPNPSSSTTLIEYHIPRRGHVRLRVYDEVGRLVKIILDGESSPGSYTVTWNGTDERGKRVPSGTYFYRLNVDGSTVTKKAIVLK